MQTTASLDLRMGVSGFDIPAVRRYLPAHKMPPTVVAWLDGALRGGLNWYRSLPLLSAKDLAKVSVPTTLVWSDDDAALGRRMAELTAEDATWVSPVDGRSSGREAVVAHVRAESK